MLKKHPLAALFVSLWLTLISLHAQFFYTDSVINIPPFTDQIEAMGSEVKEKTSWSVYLLTVNDIGEQTIIAYEKNVSQALEAPFVLLTLVVAQQQVDIYGSPGFEAVVDKEFILRNRIYPILGSPMKGDVRYKYLEAMLNGYAELAEQIAAHHNVELKTAIGNANVNTVNVLRIIFYVIIVLALGRYIYIKVKGKKHA